MKRSITVSAILLMLATAGYGGKPCAFNTSWIPVKPQVSTYLSTSKQGNGLYQVSLMKSDSGIEVYINIISPGFTKTVCGKMTLDMQPLESTAKIIVGGGVTMFTKCGYDNNSLTIKTVIAPYNRTVADTLRFPDRVIDFSQVPLLVRTLQLDSASQYSFASLNPNTNAIVPLTIKTIGEGRIMDADCYEVEMNDFEGRAIYWVEKGQQHRVMKIEEPGVNRRSELIP